MNDAATRKTLIARKGKFTLYFRQSMMPGYCKVEARSLTVTQGEYAQYDNAIVGEFVKKGARIARMLPAQTSFPSLVVLEGWGHPAPDSIWDETTRNEAPEASTVRARYSCTDSGWSTDFRAKLARYVEAGAVVLLDCHGLNAS